jgi:hypothetical protein
MFLLLSVTQAVANSIGKISDLKGNSEVVRKTSKLNGQLSLSIEQLDNVQTGNGRVEIEFLDDSTVKITEHSKLVIDDFVYSPGKPSSGKMALRFASGTVRFATGQTGKINKANINLQTPTATIAVRGTDFAATVDDFGKSLVILLPEEDGTVGEITVTNAAGSVILNRAFQATIVDTADSRPSKPVILRMDLNMIDNMMIVSPPPEDTNASGEVADKKANILDLSELDVDFLKDKSLEDDSLQTITSLDINTINADFLNEDFLDSSMSSIREKEGVKLEGTTFGYDDTTQVYAIINPESFRVFRSLNGTVDIQVDKEKGKNIYIDMNGKSVSIIVNEGNGSNIFVNQKN